VRSGSLPTTRAPKARRAYRGARRKILVVDNEEADRDLLLELLQPLGFEVRTASSGHDALDLLAAGLRPDALLMDLAMPGIDGWETLRRARSLPGFNAAVAVVSANAFDKGLENHAGIRPEDFIVKPVRHSELLDWLERRLSIEWTEAEADLPAPPPTAQAVTRPGDDLLGPLDDAVQLGYYRGVMNQLDAIDAAQPECASFTEPLRELARGFQFEAIARRLAQEPQR